MLLGEPTVLLLDEPTNHLDADGRAWLAEWLAGFSGTLLTVSHDRAFLDATVERILELSADGLESYEGGYTAYKEERERRREKLALLVEAQEKRRKRLAEDIRLTADYAQHTERTVSRAAAPKLKRYAKKVAKKAKAREHRLQREMASADWVRAPRDPAEFKVTLEAEDPGKRLVAALRGVSVEGVFDDLDLTLHGGDRVALTGANGSGKSTLLHVLAGVLEPDAGEVDVRAQVRLLPADARAAPGPQGPPGVVPRAGRAARGRGADAAGPLPAGRGGDRPPARPAEPGRAGARARGGDRGERRGPRAARRAHQPPRLRHAGSHRVSAARLPGHARRGDARLRAAGGDRLRAGRRDVEAPRRSARRSGGGRRGRR